MPGGTRSYWLTWNVAPGSRTESCGRWERFSVCFALVVAVGARQHLRVNQRHAAPVVLDAKVDDAKVDDAKVDDAKADDAKGNSTLKPAVTVTVKKGRWIKCENGQRKWGDGLSKCRVVVKKKVQEFSFQEYLISKGCPKFEKAAIRDALTCWGDQTPCKEYDMEELVNAFEGCNKIKVTRENAKKNKDSQNDPEKPDRSIEASTIFPRFSTDASPRTSKSEGISAGQERSISRTSQNGSLDLARNMGLGSRHAWKQKDGKEGTAMVFIGNKKGKSSDSSGARYITTKPLDISKGGVISFYLKDGPDEGDEGCKKTTEVFKKLEAARLARRQNETDAREKCLSKPPCNGHGEGVYSSNCFKNGKWVEGARLAKDAFDCHDRKQYHALASVTLATRHRIAK